MSPNLRKGLPIAAAIVLAAAVAGGAVYALREPLRGLADRIGGLGAWTAPAFALSIAVAVVLLVPTAPLTFGSGYFLGWIPGSAVVLLGMTVGSGIAFALARRTLRPFVRRAAERDPRLARLAAVAATGGWHVVFLTRLVPFFPSKPANYVFGLTPVRFFSFVLASLAGYVPNTLAAVYAGALAASLREAAKAGEGGNPVGWIGPALGLVALIALGRFAARAARRAYDAKANPPEPQS